MFVGVYNLIKCTTMEWGKLMSEFNEFKSAVSSDENHNEGGTSHPKSVQFYPYNPRGTVTNSLSKSSNSKFP